MTLFSGHAKDIDFRTESEFFEAIGYLANPNVLERFEAQVPEEKVQKFENELPNQDCYQISNDEPTINGNTMKTSFQLRIYLNNRENIPQSLIGHIVKGNRINRGLFAEKLLRDFGFRIGEMQDESIIRNIVLSDYPEYIADFERGYDLGNE